MNNPNKTNDYRNDEGFYDSLHQRVQAYFTKKMDARLHYNEMLAIVKQTAEEFGYQYQNLNVFGIFDSYFNTQTKPLSNTTPSNTTKEVNSNPSIRAFDRKKVV